MIIKKIMNNNVVFVKDKKKNELILVGSGIGFKMKPGMKADESKVEKTFLLSKFKEQKRLVELLSKISSEDFKLADHIIQYAKASLGTDLNENIYVTLTDHMVFAMERTRKGIIFRNALLWEIKQFYPQEFAIGQYAIEVIEKKTGIKMAEDEAGFIALHIANARSDGDHKADLSDRTGRRFSGLQQICRSYEIFCRKTDEKEAAGSERSGVH